MNLLSGIKNIGLIYLLLLLALFAQYTFSQSENVVKITVTDKDVTLKQGESVDISLSIITNSGWHINSNKPNDEFLIPSVITAKGSGLVLSSVKYPKAHDLKLSFSEEPVSVFEGTVTAKLSFKSNQ